LADSGGEIDQVVLFVQDWGADSVGLQEGGGQIGSQIQGGQTLVGREKSDIFPRE